MVATLGRSMEKNVALARRLGALHIPDASIVQIEDIDDLEPGKVCVLSTGSQGEPMSALARLASGENRFLRLTEGDVVVISAHPIPGNEWSVGRVIDGLHRRGVEVIHSGVEAVHVSGHARQGELAMLLSVTRPEFFIPVHGEYRHMANHVRLATTMGITGERALLCEDGDAVRLDSSGLRRDGTVPGGYLFVDGSTVGDVGHGVLRDRLVLAEEGVVMAVATVDVKREEVVGVPQIVTRGWATDRETEALLDEARGGGDQGPRAGALRREQRPRDPQPGGAQGGRSPGGRAHPPASHDRPGDRDGVSTTSGRCPPGTDARRVPWCTL